MHRRPGGRARRRRRLPAAAAVALAAVILGCAAGCDAGPAIPAGRVVRAPTVSHSAGAPAAPGPWRVVALGDSVTSGGPCGCTPFPQLYAEDLARVRGARVSVRNLGSGGLDSGGLLTALQDGGSGAARAVAGADIVLLTIGANDFTDRHGDVTAGTCLTGAGNDCVSDDLASMRQNVTAVLATVHRLRAGRPTAVLVTGYWNVFEDGAVARESFSDLGVRATQRLTRMVNASLRSVARGAGTTYVDLFAPFNGPAGGGDPTRLLFSDGDHPNQAGQRLIAARLVAAGLPGLTRG